LAELLHVLRLEQHGPGVDLVDAQHGLDLVDVVADAVGAPQVRHGVLVARIVLLQALQQRRVEVGIVGQQDLSSFWNAPALICLPRKWLDGTTTS
jgi:hypothetical protein